MNATTLDLTPLVLLVLDLTPLVTHHLGKKSDEKRE